MLDTFCPYVGLQPFTEVDRDYFFGRERDQRIISSNLYAAPLTILYGMSGVGKSSILMAGVVPYLRNRPRTVVVVFREWQDGFLIKLKDECLKEIATVQSKPIDIDKTLPFDDFLFQVGEIFSGSMLILFDQFEEYFHYHPETEISNTFDAEFARAVNREEVDASFLISLREDSLAKLDRFRMRIPNLLGNTLRLEHMDAAAAEEAILKPLDVYNKRFPLPVTIEDRLVKAILENRQLQAGWVTLGQQMDPAQTMAFLEIREGTKQRIEVPFLQLVMERLWEELNENSHTLTLDTLMALGGIEKIVNTHLEGKMSKLDKIEQEVCAKFFDRLVTPSGSKNACRLDDLIQWSGQLSKHVPRVLKSLEDSRILRKIEPTPSQKNTPSHYEIFHDVLAPGILVWRKEYLNKLEITHEKKRLQVLWFKCIGTIFVLSIISFLAYTRWMELKPWGYAMNLSSRVVYPLKGDVTRIGRSSEKIENDISLIPGNVSRIHLLIFRQNLSIYDMRSTNGTTINAEILPYGDSRQLRDGDIFVLAGIAPFKFSSSPMKAISPSTGWALVIDGKAGAVSYLNADQYFLSIDENNLIVLEQQLTEDTLLTIRRNSNGISTIEDRDDDLELIATMKVGDYYYLRYVVDSGVQFDHFVTRDEENNKDERHDIFEVSYSYRGLPFQIVPIEPDLTGR